jgi:hypothetical protein
MKTGDAADGRRQSRSAGVGLEGAKVMRRSMKIIVLAGALIAVSSAKAAQAQVIEAMKFRTTFPFTAGHTNFPAGMYTVRPLDLTTGVMEITNVKGGAKFIVVLNAGIKTNEKVSDEVVFKKNGDSYVLSEIRDGAEHSGVEVLQDKAQRNEEPGAHHHYGHQS